MNNLAHLSTNDMNNLIVNENVGCLDGGVYSSKQVIIWESIPINPPVESRAMRVSSHWFSGIGKRLLLVLASPVEFLLIRFCP